MGVFDTGSLGYQLSSVGTSATAVFTANSTTPSPGLHGLNPPVKLQDLTILNSGPVTVYLGSSSVTAVTGIPLQPGQQLTIQGYNAMSGTTTNDVYGVTSSGSATVQAGLPSTVSVI